MNSTSDSVGVTISSDIVGPGIIVGYLAMATATVLVLVRPSWFDGIPNGMSCIVMALAYSMASVVLVHRAAINQESLSFATAMTNIALVFATTSMLSRAQIRGLPRVVIFQKKDSIQEYHPLLSKIPKDIPGSYMFFFIIGMLGCLAMNGWAAYWEARARSTIIFRRVNAVLLGFQAVFIIVTWFASQSGRIKRNRFVILVPIALIFIIPSFVWMIYAHVKLGVTVNFTSNFNYGEVFNGAAGVAGLLATIVVWVNSWAE